MSINNTPFYRCWHNMRQRCHNPNKDSYKHYGGRGIKVHSQWNSFEKFAADVGPHPGKGWTLDRIDNNGDYEPSNVRWAMLKTQQRNSRQTKRTEQKAAKIIAMYKRGKMKQCDIATKFGIPSPIVNRIIRGNLWR